MQDGSHEVSVPPLRPGPQRSGDSGRQCQGGSNTINLKILGCYPPAVLQIRIQCTGMADPGPEH